MRTIQTLLCLLFLTVAASAQFNFTEHVNCSRGESLQSAIAFSLPGTTLVLNGACAGPVSIITNGLQLNGGGTASITGAGRDAVTINGAQRVLLTGLTISGGNNGVVVENNAQAALQNVFVSNNALTGLLVQANSAVAVNNGGSFANGLNGVDIESSSSLTVSSGFLISGNTVFGVDVNNGSSLTLTAGDLNVTGNAVGVQLGTNASGFLDGASTLNASSNATIGLTMVSGAHMVDFGGSIGANSNGLQGIALDSRAALDLDAGAQVQAENNAGDGVHLEEQSVMSIFNTPQFSGSSGTTTLSAQGNQGNGINLLTNSSILVDNYAALQVIGNTQAGVALDDGSSLSFGQTVPVSGVQSNLVGNHPDAALTFASRITTFSNNTIGTLTCDADSLVRGPLAVTCPH